MYYGEVWSVLRGSGVFLGGSTAVIGRSAEGFWSSSGLWGRWLLCTTVVSASFLQNVFISWKVAEFKIQIFQAWKVMKLGLGPGKSWKINQMVPAFLTHVHVLQNFGLHFFSSELHTFLFQLHILVGLHT